jgi:hypothetical protein
MHSVWLNRLAFSPILISRSSSHKKVSVMYDSRGEVWLSLVDGQLDFFPFEIFHASFPLRPLDKIAN